jgi:hypothetical protein
MYLSNMVPTQTPAKTTQTSVLRRTGTGALDSGSIKYIDIRVLLLKKILVVGLASMFSCMMIDVIAIDES